MHIYTEQDVHTYLNCNTLYYLNGSIIEHDLPYKILKYSLHKIYSDLLSKTDLISLDKHIFKVVTASIDIYLNIDDYPSSYIVLLKRYIIDVFHTLVKWYPLTKYLPVAVDLNPLYSFSNASYTSSINIVFKNINRKYLHGVVLTQDLNNIYKNPFVYLNLNYLKKYASFSIKKKQDVFTLTYIKPDPFTTTYTSTKDWKLKRIVLTSKDLTSHNLNYAFNTLDKLNFENLSHKTFCNFHDCKKRKECNELRRF
tara:strand:+ start:199 stop:960 length:762 start_codon:yes stop_codon:yes gene_type:complete